MPRRPVATFRVETRRTRWVRGAAVVLGGAALLCAPSPAVIAWHSTHHEVVVPVRMLTVARTSQRCAQLVDVGDVNGDGHDEYDLVYPPVHK